MFAGLNVFSPRGYRNKRAFFACALLAAVGPFHLFALDRHVPLTEYQRRSWTTQDGYALGEVISLAQTPDGFLWVGTSRGLRRFDGVNFARINEDPGVPLPGASLNDSRIQSLLVSHDGALWIGTLTGVSRFSGGKLKSYTTADGLPRGGVVSLLEDRDGVLWLGTAGPDGGGLASITGNAIRRYQQSDSLPGVSVFSLFEDRSRNLWAGFAGACLVHPGAQRFCPVPASAEITGIAESPDGALTFSDTAGKSLISVRIGEGRSVNVNKAPVAGRPGKQLVDHDGNLWICTTDGGILRSGFGKLQSLTASQGLLSNAVNSVFEDRDGSLWIGSLRGLTRLRNPVASHLTVPGSNFPTVVLPANDGRVWVGTAGSGLVALAASPADSHSAPIAAKRSIYSLHELGGEPGVGELWIGARDGLFRLRSGKLEEIGGKQGKPFPIVCAIADDGKGTLWFLDAQGRVYKSNDPGQIPGPLPWWQGRHARAIYASHEGTLWVGFTDGKLETLHSAGPPANALPDSWHPGIIYGIAEDRAKSIWIAAREGLGRFRNGRWTVWGNAEGIPPGGLYSLLAEESGVWAMTPARLIHIAAGPLRATPDGAPQPLPVVAFGADEGIELPDNGSVTSPRMALTGDGRLIVPTNTGLAVFDARRAIPRPGATPAFIDRFYVDGQALPVVPEPRVRGRQFQFYFSTPNINAGDATRMYYHLDGVDQNWIESRDDRRAAYGLLRPGDYTFRVRTTGGSRDASMTFHITPLFYETRYFPVLVLAALGLAARAVYLLRMKQLRARMELVFQERLRVTRDLHDSLLQGFTAVLFQLDSAARDFDRAPEASRTRLNRALEQAGQSMKEARHAIGLLRLPALENQTLSEALAEAGTQIVQGLGPGFSSHVDHDANNLPYPVQANLFVIARELIGNAATHAKASKIVLRLTCAEDGYRLTVEDDGKGFDTASVQPEAGHIGLSAVRERSSLIGGVFTMESKPGQGTRCEVAGRVARK